jgi:1-aminocyclopropane-1-carboxylate deaminase
MLLRYNLTPIQELKHPLCEAADVKVLIKREDLNHPEVSGNKWWKLKYNLEEAQRHGYNTILTFGGAYSNHIYATAAAAAECKFKSIGIIRGEELSKSNPTLDFAASKGMQFEVISREAYRMKDDENFLSTLRAKYPMAYIIPEGGTNEFALRGVREFTNDILNKIEFNYLILPVGTGGTISGIMQRLNNGRKILGTSVLRNGGFLQEDIKALIGSEPVNCHWEILTDFHYGGYGKVTEQLMQLILDMRDNHHLPLDPIYTGKAMGAMLSKIQEGYFPKGSMILFLHTGGLQGSETHVSAFTKKSK